MYNDKFFGPQSRNARYLNNSPSNSIICAVFLPHNDIDTDEYIFKDYSHDIPSIEKATTLPPTINHSIIINSK